MKHRWITIPGILLSLAVASPNALAARKKQKDATVSTEETATSKKTKASNKKKAPAAPPVPVRPPADIPPVTEAASVWQGCLEQTDVPKLASRLGMEESKLASLLAEEKVLGTENRACVPYVAATGGESGVASATFQRNEVKPDQSAVVAIRKTADGVIVTPGACDCREATRRVLTVPAKDIANSTSEQMAELPKTARWQLAVLVPQMIHRLGQKQSAAQEIAAPSLETPSSASEFISQTKTRDQEIPSDAHAADQFSVRVVVESHNDSDPEHLQSVELLEASTGQRLDSAWWLEREDRPGVFIGTDGLAYERGLWLNPVKYNYTSRGVGPAVTTFRSRIKLFKGKSQSSTQASTQANSKDTTVRTVKVRGLHLGLDMLAPKGNEVHAVSDATVAFAGRQGGYGNLVILDHGLGYQTYYAHLSKIEPGVKSGAKVVGGEVIGLVGSTGRSTAPHLHFETRKDHKYLDPLDNSHQLEFWLLSADDQERLAMQLLTPPAPINHAQTVVANPQTASPTGGTTVSDVSLGVSQ